MDSGLKTVDAHSYGYNPANQRVIATLADGSYWRYEYDALGQVRSGKKHWSDQTPVAGQQFEYAFDDIGNRRSTKSGGDQSGGGLQPADYSVNLLNQYTSRDVPGCADIFGLTFATYPATVNGQSTYRKGEYYRKELSVANSATPVWQPVSVATNNGVTGLSGNVFVPGTPEAFTYDADGNLTQDGRWSYEWDGENRLKVMRSLAGSPAPERRIKFEYDSRGRRIRQTVWSDRDNGEGSELMDTLYVYDGWNLLAELDANAGNGRVRTYTWGLDLSGSEQGAGGVGGLLQVSCFGTQTTNCFVAFDGNGNVGALVNTVDGATMAQYEYGPFGEVIRSTGPMSRANPFRFSTKYQDRESDLLYYGYRYYNASTGRWLSRDPIGEVGGLNLYGMVDNDPINEIDPAGLHKEPHEEDVLDKLQSADISLASMLPFDVASLPVTWKGRVFWRQVCCGTKHSKPGNAGQTRYRITVPQLEPDVDGTIEATAVKTWVKNWVRKKISKKAQHLIDLIDGDLSLNLKLNGKFRIHYDGCAESIVVAGSSNAKLTGNAGLSTRIGTADDYAALGVNGSVAGGGVLVGKGVNTKVEIILRKGASVDLNANGYAKIVVAKNPVLDESFKGSINVYKSTADATVVSFDLMDYVK